MELHKDIFYKELGKMVFGYCCNVDINFNELINAKAIESLQRIKTVIENDSLSDFDCVEKIVCIFEDIGSNCGNRHDFG